MSKVRERTKKYIKNNYTQIHNKTKLIIFFKLIYVSHNIISKYYIITYKEILKFYTINKLYF